MINKRDALWGVVGVVSLALFFVTAIQLLMVRPIPWAGLLAVVILGGIGGGIPMLPKSILSRYRMLWLLPVGAFGILGFWPGARTLRALGLAIAWSIATTGHFWRKWRFRKAPMKSRIAPEDSQNAEP